MKNRIMALAMVGVLSLGVLAGCGEAAPAATNDAAVEAETPAAETEEVVEDAEATEAAEDEEAAVEEAAEDAEEVEEADAE